MSDKKRLCIIVNLKSRFQSSEFNLVKIHIVFILFFTYSPSLLYSITIIIENFFYTICIIIYNSNKKRIKMQLILIKTFFQYKFLFGHFLSSQKL